MDDRETARAAALSLLANFCERILPGALRRIAIWKGIPRRTMLALRDDVRQELALDCLEHIDEVLAAPPARRHARWMRRAERHVYVLLSRHRRYDDLPHEPTSPPARAHRWPAVELPSLVRLQNGRANVARSLRAAGADRRRLRRRLDDVAEQLGWNDERYAFWRARAVEALIGLAADLLRERGQVLLLRPRPRPPDAERRLRRLRRLARRFPIRPATRAVRSALRPWLRGPVLERADPRRLLEDAVALQPDAPAGWLWLFEACCSAGDLRAAARALRRGRQHGALRSGIALARARLLEARGRLDAGVRLLRRAARRWPAERALLTALRAARPA